MVEVSVMNAMQFVLVVLYCVAKNDGLIQCCGIIISTY